MCVCLREWINVPYVCFFFFFLNFQKNKKERTQSTWSHTLSPRLALLLPLPSGRQSSSLQGQTPKRRPSTMTPPTPGNPAVAPITSDKPRRPPPVNQAITSAEQHFLLLSLHFFFSISSSSACCFCFLLRLPKTTTWWQAGETARPASLPARIPVLRLAQSRNKSQQAAARHSVTSPTPPSPPPPCCPHSPTLVAAAALHEEGACQSETM